MNDLLEADRRLSPSEPQTRQRRARRTRRVLWVAACLLPVAALGYLIPDQLREQDRYVQARTALGATRQRSQEASAQLDELRHDLGILESQVGSDSTALSQDTSQLLGAQTSLTAARAHVTQQAQLIGSLQTCLTGVEQALNELAIGKESAAIAALNSVSAGCAAAEASSG